MDNNKLINFQKKKIDELKVKVAEAIASAERARAALELARQERDELVKELTAAKLAVTRAKRKKEGIADVA